MIEPVAFVIALAGVFLIAFSKGALGGGFASIGIPLLSLGMDPLTAGALLAPLLVVMDCCALRYWRPGTWSLPDLVILLPALGIGIALGYLAMTAMNRHAVEIAVGTISLIFAALWLHGGARVAVRPRSMAKGLAAGMASGVTTMIAHAGAPPLAMYLLPRGLPKPLYVGTMSIFFTAANIIKLVPWLLLAGKPQGFGMLMLICMPVIPLGVWLGWRLHQRLDQRRLYSLGYGVLAMTALKLLWDGISGLL